MQTKTFIKKLKKVINSSGDFIVDLVELDKKTPKQFGFDDAFVVSGKKIEDQFIISVFKIK